LGRRTSRATGKARSNPAAEARVSRATAYLYYSNEKALLQDAELDSAAPTPEQLFAGDTSRDPIERLLKADAALRKVVWENQNQFRLFLARVLEEAATANEVPSEPLRQNRRTRLIEAALSPARDQFDAAVYRKLCAALALVFGTESMVVFRDVLQMDDPEASEVESWAVQVLARAALAESEPSRDLAKASAGKPKKRLHN